MAAHVGLEEYIGPSPVCQPAPATSAGERLPTEYLARLRERGLTSTELGALVVSPRTFKRRTERGEGLSLEESARAVRVTGILAFAEEVFGNRDKSLRWLRGKDDRLDDKTALSLLKTEAGCEVVRSMLWQIAEGVFT